MTDELLLRLAETADSFYLYDEKTILAQTGKLKRLFPQVNFLYSVKCCHNREVMRCVFSQGFGADAASAGEVRASSELGLTAGEIFYSAPGKTEKDLAETMGKAVIIADSLNEIGRIDRIAAERGETAEIGVRVNPAFSMDGGAGGSSKFGIDEEQLLEFLREKKPEHVRIAGIHVHLKSQILDADVMAGYYRRVLQLADRAEGAAGTALRFVNLGSGLGVPYAAGDRGIDLEKAAAALTGDTRGRKIYIEVGRYAVCGSGVYVSKVVDRKVSRGKTYVILKNTLNGFIRPSLERLVAHYSTEESPAGTEPLYTEKNSFGFRVVGGDETHMEKADLVGNLCTAADVIAEGIELPRAECGSLVVMTNAGAYAAVLSPTQFSSQEPPREFFLKADGTEI